MSSKQALKDTNHGRPSTLSKKSLLANPMKQGDLTLPRSPLLALPVELREMIYAQVFQGAVVRSGVAEKLVKGPRRKISRGKGIWKDVATLRLETSDGISPFSEPGLLTTCRLIRIEARDLFLSSLVWTFEQRDEDYWTTSVDQMKVFLNRLTRHPKNFGHVCITLPFIAFHDTTHVGCINGPDCVNCTCGNFQVTADRQYYRVQLSIASAPPGLKHPPCANIIMNEASAGVEARMSKVWGKLSALGLTSIGGVGVVIEAEN